MAPPMPMRRTAAGLPDGFPPGMGDIPLTGFSHGAAGIGLALHTAAEVLDERRFRDAAADAFAYERRVFDADRGNWPDFRQVAENGQPSWSVRWCHGAPGIALTRLRDPSAADEVAAALHTTAAYADRDVDQLCCGHAGRADVLLTAGRALGRPELVAAAAARLAWVLEREQAGETRYFHQVHTPVYSPGLLAGAAGIGYQALRQRDPDALPSLLTWGRA